MLKALSATQIEARNTETHLDIAQGRVTDGHNRKRHLAMQKAPSGVIGGVATVERSCRRTGERVGATSGVAAAPIGTRATRGAPWCSVVPRVVVAEVLGVVLALLEVLLEPQWHRQLHDVVASHTLEDGKATHVLQGVDRLEAGHGEEELDGSGREAGGAGTQEVEEAAAARVRHRLLDELDDRRLAVRLGLGVEAEHTWGGNGMNGLEEL